MSVRTKVSSVKDAIEALRRCKYKFPGGQKILVSRSWGFTKFSHPEYRKLQSEGKVIPDGAHCKIRVAKGRLQ